MKAVDLDEEIRVYLWAQARKGLAEASQQALRLAERYAEDPSRDAAALMAENCARHVANALRAAQACTALERVSAILARDEERYPAHRATTRIPNDTGESSALCG